MSEPSHFSNLIDVWNVVTFDAELCNILNAHADLIRDFCLTSRRQWLEREASDHLSPYPDNPHASGLMRLKENILMPLMEDRTIRAWHYTRLTEVEVDQLRTGGIYLSTLTSIWNRLAAMVAAGVFSQNIADRLFADSPFQSEQLGSRTNKFWMVSHPFPVDSSGVELLLESWGGESAYFWQRDPELQELLKQLGTPRVLELAMPLHHSSHAYSAAEAVVATYGWTVGARPEKKTFDLYTHEPIGPEHIRAVHSEGDATFAALGRGYPDGYVDPIPY